jgi:hypothetical protein
MMTEAERLALECFRDDLRRRFDRRMDSFDDIDDYDLLDALKVVGFELRKG